MSDAGSSPTDGPTPEPDAGAPPGGGDSVAVRTLVVGGLPLLVAVVGDHGRGPRLRSALQDAGLLELPAFIGYELPKGAKVGFSLDGDELKLKDESDDTLLRAPRPGLDEGWVEAAGRLKGTMTVVLTGAAPEPDLPGRDLAAVVDERARAGAAIGAIVGVVEERPGLPLIF